MSVAYATAEGQVGACVIHIEVHGPCRYVWPVLPSEAMLVSMVLLQLGQC